LQCWQDRRHWFLANLAHLAYYNENDIRETIIKLGGHSKYFDSDGTQAYLAEWDDMAVLAFRGSQPMERIDSINFRVSGFFGDVRDVLKGQKKFTGIFSAIFKYSTPFTPIEVLFNDVLADANIVKVPLSDGAMVHKGFLKELDDIWNQISSKIEAVGKQKSLWVTGHSLGAALATLAGTRFPFEKVVTFGEPRVGSNIGKVFKSKQHIRYVNGKDIVPQVPPEWLDGYQHHGKLEPLSYPKKETQNQEESVIKTLDLLYDHSILNYMENL